MENKELYEEFCKANYVPIYSQPWWMDAVCESHNWDVWLCDQGNKAVAAMPYYMEKRGSYRYITKAPLTQTNGITFSHAPQAKPISIQKTEERIIDRACDFIASLGVDVYEQQYAYTFENWLPFFWHEYTALARYTYVLEDTSNLDALFSAMDSKARGKIRKGAKNAHFSNSIDPDEFFFQHEKIFAKQGLPCPFSYDLWRRLYTACYEHGCCELLCERLSDGQVASLLFLVWDSKSAYAILGGSMPEHQNLDTYHALIWEGIKLAHEKGLKYDFEGSVIKRISKSFREFGGTPKLYFRIRKIFNPEIIRMEAEQQISRLES